MFSFCNLDTQNSHYLWFSHIQQWNTRRDTETYDATKAAAPNRPTTPSTLMPWSKQIIWPSPNSMGQIIYSNHITAWQRWEKEWRFLKNNKVKSTPKMPSSFMLVFLLSYWLEHLWINGFYCEIEIPLLLNCQSGLNTWSSDIYKPQFNISPAVY